MKQTCYICWTEKDDDNEIRHFPFYVYGSEGVLLCFSCQMALTNTIKEMARAAGKSRKIAYKACKRIISNNQQKGGIND